VQISFGYGLFTGGFGLHQGVERAGGAVVPSGSGNTERQIMLMQDLKSELVKKNGVRLSFVNEDKDD